MPLPRIHLALLLSAAMAVVGCRIGGETRYEDKVTFPDLYDSLKQYERAVIIFQDKDGRVLDTVFNGPVGSAEQLRSLAVENWDGGDAIIRIIGITGGKDVYLIEKHFDGASGRTESTVLLRTPTASLGATVREYLLVEGDSLPIPGIVVQPIDLADKSLLWTSSHPDIVAIGPTHLKGLRQGAAQLTARLKSDESKSLSLLVKVAIDARVPERIAIVPETLRVAAGGAPLRASARAFPVFADASVAWSIDDPGAASVDADGRVRGIRKGATRLRAGSKRKPSISGSAVVLVADSVPVQKIRFLKDSTGLYLGGAPESLIVEVNPPEADPGITLLSSSPGVASVRGGLLHAAAEGRTTIIAVSVENPALTDTLHVRVSTAPGVDSVRIAPRRLKLFVGGDAGSIAARVFPPTAPEEVRWISGNPSLARADAAGRVFPLAAGNLRIYAVSAADSLARDSAEVSVKVDAPVVAIGADTVLPVGGTLTLLPVVAPQEFGVVTAFKWDLDGDLAWDDSAASVRSVSRRYEAEATHVARFLVRDTEGNETLARKQVRVVKGRIVRILSPIDGSYAREARIAVRWSVDGVEQDSLTTQTLAEGPNFITRSAPDSGGRLVTAAILVTLDAVPPAGPAVAGPYWVRTPLPSWSWASGGGSGDFRVALDAETFQPGSETRDTVYVPSQDLAEGPHTLYVQERDAAGNWSASGRHTLRVDLTPPGRPSVLIEPGNPTNAPKPAFRWQGGGGGMGLYQYKLDSASFGNPTAELSHVPAVNLASGGHSFQIRERDSAGHWSAATSVVVTLDFTAPEPPKIAGSSPTSAMPRWAWNSGGGGGSGDYRFKVGSDGNPANGGTETRALEYALPAATSGTSYTLYLQERDAAGNWSSIESLPIIYDLTRPAVTIRSPQSAGTYLTRQPTVDVSGSSSKPEGGSPIQAITYTLDGAPGTLPTNLASDGTWSIRGLPLVNDKKLELKVTAKDQSGNSGDAILLLAMDSTPPPPPAFTIQPPAIVNAADTRTTLAWTWTRPGAATDSFVVRLNGTVVSRQTETTYSQGNLTDGTYALQVSSFDLAGNLSAPVSATVVTVDRKKPVIASYSIEDGFITNRSPITIRFTRDGVADSLSCVLTDGGSKVCEKAVSDAAGNTVNATRTIWYRSNVVFVKAGQTGTRGGTSWADAFGDIGTALGAIAGRTGRMELWVTEGEFTQFTINRSSTSIYGGFASTGHPNSVNSRDPGSRMSRIKTSGEYKGCIIIAGDGSICRDVIIDGFQVRQGTSQAIFIANADNATIRNLWAEGIGLNGIPGVIQIGDGSHTFENIYVRDNSTGSLGSIYLFGLSNLTIRNSDISGNTQSSQWGSAGIYSEYGGRVTIRNSTLKRNQGDNTIYQAFNYGLGVFDIDSCVVEGLRNGVYPLNNDSLVIWGKNNKSP